MPSSVDEITGYRIYSDHDLERAQANRTLKTLELPLNAIEELLSKHDDDSDFVTFLGQHGQSIIEEIRKHNDIERIMDATIQTAQQWKSALDRNINIHERTLDLVLFAGQRRRGHYGEIQQSGQALLDPAHRPDDSF